MLAGGVAALIRNRSRTFNQPNTQINPDITTNPSQAPSPAASNIVDTLDELGAFRYFVAAIKLSDLNESLINEGEFTVFAPIDEGVATMFDKPPSLPATSSSLNRIVKYHVVPGRIESSELLNSPTLKTIEGQSITVKIENNAATIGDAQIIGADIPASNGVIHVISSALIPR